MQQITDNKILDYEEISSSEYIKNEIPLTEKAKSNVLENRKAIQKIILGEDSRKILIIGPCSIHNTEEALEYAENLSKLREKVKDKFLVLMRTYFEKPRTTTGWKGLINDPEISDSFNIEKGLRVARELLIKINEKSLGCATEFLEPNTPQYIDDLISWSSIGARTTESQTHREIASGLPMPVGFKNTAQGTVKPAINSLKSSSNPHSFLGINKQGKISIIKTKGNPDCHLILRGGISGPNYHKKIVKQIQEELSKSGLQPNIIIDCSHGNSNKDFKKQEEIFIEILKQIKKGNNKIIGLMLESYINEGKQKIPRYTERVLKNQNPKRLLKKGISITDACLGWNDTKKIVLENYDFLINFNRLG